MPIYRCLVLGENFLLEIDGELQRLGFQTTRWVEADDPEAAELAVLDVLRREDAFNRPGPDYEGPAATVSFEQIDEISVEEVGRMQPHAGYTFFAMDETS